jgi:hypothetical protein
MKKTNHTLRFILSALVLLALAVVMIACTEKAKYTKPVVTGLSVTGEADGMFSATAAQPVKAAKGAGFTALAAEIDLVEADATVEGDFDEFAGIDEAEKNAPDSIEPSYEIYVREGGLVTVNLTISNPDECIILGVKINNAWVLSSNQTDGSYFDMNADLTVVTIGFPTSRINTAPVDGAITYALTALQYTYGTSGTGEITLPNNAITAHIVYPVNYSVDRIGVAFTQYYTSNAEYKLADPVEKAGYEFLSWTVSVGELSFTDTIPQGTVGGLEAAGETELIIYTITITNPEVLITEDGVPCPSVIYYTVEDRDIGQGRLPFSCVSLGIHGGRERFTSMWYVDTPILSSMIWVPGAINHEEYSSYMITPQYLGDVVVTIWWNNPFDA